MYTAISFYEVSYICVCVCVCIWYVYLLLHTIVYYSSYTVLKVKKSIYFLLKKKNASFLLTTA